MAEFKKSIHVNLQSTQSENQPFQWNKIYKSTNLKIPPLIRLENEICTKSEIQPFQWNKFQSDSKNVIKQNPPLPWNKIEISIFQISNFNKIPHFNGTNYKNDPQKINHKNSPIEME